MRLNEFGPAWAVGSSKDGQITASGSGGSAPGLAMMHRPAHRPIHARRRGFRPMPLICWKKFPP